MSTKNLECQESAQMGSDKHQYLVKGSCSETLDTPSHWDVSGNNQLCGHLNHHRKC